MGFKSNEMVGEKFGRLTVIRSEGSKQCGSVKRRMWLCRCDCGNEVSVTTSSLTTGNTRSCGCLLDEYNASKKPDPQEKKIRLHIENVWFKIKQRCYNPKSNNYRAYGARGIRMCDEWLNNSKAFANWCLNNGYQIGLEIDRIDNDGNYEPSNCQFLTKRENILKEARKLVIAGIPLRYGEISNIVGKTKRFFSSKVYRIGLTKAYAQTFHSLAFGD